jgi:hypothetical protein
MQLLHGVPTPDFKEDPSLQQMWQQLLSERAFVSLGVLARGMTFNAALAVLMRALTPDSSRQCRRWSVPRVRAGLAASSVCWVLVFRGCVRDGVFGNVARWTLRPSWSFCNAS